VTTTGRFIDKHNLQMLGKALSAAIGVDDISQVYAVSFRTSLREPSTVTIEKYLTVEQAENIKAVLQQWELNPTPIGETAKVSA
jgi:hypothetical protein